MGGISATTRQPEPRQPRHPLAENCWNLAGPGSYFARPVSRRHRLSELVIGCRLERIYGRKQDIGARREISAAILRSGPDRQRPHDLQSERVSEKGLRHARSRISRNPSSGAHSRGPWALRATMYLQTK